VPGAPADLADEAALRRLVDGYAFAVDDRDPVAFVGLFTPDGTLCVHDGYRGPERHCYRGSAELATVIDRIGRYDQTMHATTSHRVRLLGDAATGETHCLAHHVTHGEAGAAEDRILYITYLDDFVRAPDGTWRIGRRGVHTRWTQTVPVVLPIPPDGSAP